MCFRLEWEASGELQVEIAICLIAMQLSCEKRLKLTIIASDYSESSSNYSDRNSIEKRIKDTVDKKIRSKIARDKFGQVLWDLTFH